MQTLWESPIAYRLPSRKLNSSLIFYKMDTALVLISLAITTSMIFICGFIGLCIYTCFKGDWLHTGHSETSANYSLGEFPWPKFYKDFVGGISDFYYLNRLLDLAVLCLITFEIGDR